MRARWVACIAFTAVFVGCAADGGPTGTGISTLIRGNVIAVESSTGTSDPNTTAVRVTIDEMPGIEDTTNAAGDFDLSGTFSGLLIVRFTAVDVSATQALDVPAGSEIVLSDVVVGPRAIRLRAARQMGFLGSIALVDCEAGDLLIDDRAPRKNQFLVRLVPDTILVDGDANAVACSALKTGSPVAIEGVIRLAERTIEAITVTIDPPQPGEPSPLAQTSFSGTIMLVNCESGMAQLDGPTGAVRLRFSGESNLLDAEGQPIECTAIEPGDAVEGAGNIRVRRPEVVDVTEMRLKSPQEG
jgi:hypothetical protein